MNLHDQIKLDAAALIDLNGFGEQVVYKPKGGSPKTITVVVSRNLPSKLAETNRNLTDYVEVAVSNDATTGVTSINVHGDKIELAAKYGGEVTDHTVTRIVSQDEGVWILGVK